MLYSSQDDSTSELTVWAIIYGHPEVADLGIWLHSMGYSSQFSISCISFRLAVSEANWPNLIPCLELSKDEPRWLRQLLLSVPEAQSLSSLILFSMAKFQRIFPRMVQMDLSLHLQQPCSFSLADFLRRAYRECSVSSCSSIHTSGCAELINFQRGRSQSVVQKVSIMAKSCLAFRQAVQSLWAVVGCGLCYGCLMSEWICVRCWLVTPVVSSLLEGSCLSRPVLPPDLLAERFII